MPGAVLNAGYAARILCHFIFPEPTVSGVEDGGRESNLFSIPGVNGLLEKHSEVLCEHRGGAEGQRASPNDRESHWGLAGGIGVW